MAKHNRAAFSREDIEDSERGHPDFAPGTRERRQPGPLAREAGARIGRASPLPVCLLTSVGPSARVVSGTAERWDAGWMAKHLHDAVYESLIGGATGEALGALVDGWHYTDIHREHGKEERVAVVGDGPVQVHRVCRGQGGHEPERRAGSRRGSLAGWCAFRGAPRRCGSRAGWHVRSACVGR